MKRNSDFNSECNRLKRKNSFPSPPMEEVDEFVESMTARGIQVPRYGMNNFLRIPRESLVRKAIDIVENRDKHIYISGAAGVGKTMLLQLIAIQLKKEGKRSIFILVSVGMTSKRF